MMFSMTFGTMASAETSAAEIVTVIATDTQVRLGTTVKELIEVDGLQFKDLNGNGQLDVYEDWRADTEDRVTDLLSQMTLKEKTMLLYHICTCSDNTGVDFSNPDTLYLQEGTYDGSHYSMWVHINEFGITHYLDNSNGTPDEQVYAHNEMQSMAEGSPAQAENIRSPAANGKLAAGLLLPIGNGAAIGLEGSSSASTIAPHAKSAGAA